MTERLNEARAEEDWLRDSVEQLEKNGKIKDGYSKKILWDGFNGIVDIQMVGDFQKSTKFKLKDGKILQDT